MDLLRQTCVHRLWLHDIECGTTASVCVASMYSTVQPCAQCPTMTNLQYEWREVGVTVVSGGWGYSGSCVVYPGDFRTMLQPHNVWAFLL